MGISIDLEKVNYKEFVNKLLENEKIKDKELLERIILEFGNKIGDELVILHNEYYEDGTCSWNMCNMIEEVFGLKSDENSEDYVYDIYSDLNSYLISYKEIDEAYENLGLRRKEDKS